MLANASVRCTAPCAVRPQRPFTARLAAVKVGLACTDDLSSSSVCLAAEGFLISLNHLTGAREASGHRVLTILADADADADADAADARTRTANHVIAALSPCHPFPPRTYNPRRR